MTAAPAANSSQEPSTLEPLAVNTQVAADSSMQAPPESDFFEPQPSEPQPSEPSDLSGEPASSAALQAIEGDHEIKEIKSTMLDSAELANQAAGHALKAGAELQQASHNLIQLHATQRNLGLIVLVSCCTLMVSAMVLFVFISARLQQRIAQADAMLLAVGKRVVAMNESLELISGTGEILRDISSNQSAISSQQNKLEGRFDEVLRATQSAVNSPTKDSKTQDINKLLQSMELQIKGNFSAIKSLSVQLRAKPTAGPTAVVIRREVEAALRQQQNKAPPSVVAPVAPVASPAPVKPVERLIQYPRAQSTPTVTP
jgi:hypothetical protein